MDSPLPPVRRPNARRLLLVLLLTPVALITLARLAIRFILRSPEIVQAMPLPPELKAPRVLFASVPLIKKPFVRAGDLGEITDMRRFGAELVLAGTDGAAVADEGGAIKGKRTMFSRYSASTKIVPDAAGPGYSFFLQGNVMEGPALLDSRGRTLWKSSETVESSAAGDLSGKGDMAFALGYNGGDGVELRDREGKPLWRLPAANPWHMEIGELGAGQRGIVHSDAGGRIVVRDRGGKTTSSKAETYFDEFASLRWPGPSGEPALLAGGPGGLLVVDFKGKTLARLPAAVPASNGKAKPLAAAYVAFERGKPADLAVLARVSPYIERMILYLYAPDGTLRYSELLGQSGGSLLAVPETGRPDAQRLLLGGKDAVFSFSY